MSVPLEKSIEMLQAMRAPQGFMQGVLRRCGLVDGYAKVPTPIGVAYVATSDCGITAVMEARSDAEFELRYRERFGRRSERRDELASKLERELADPENTEVDLRACHPFQRAVLEATRRIPAGSVRPYSWVAREIGQPGAVRAVGTALARNPVPLIVPCHRVVRSDGETGHYALGDDDKVVMLQHEGVDIAEVRRRMGKRRFWTEEGESTYCYPYCFAAHPLRDRHIIEFHSVEEAQHHGLTPCETCHAPLAA